jgi:lysophospholipase L1-like esterase
VTAGAAVVTVVACLTAAIAVLAAGAGPAVQTYPKSTDASPTGTAAPSAAASRVARAHPDGLRVATVGDSVTAGAACRCDPFPVVYADRLAERLGVPVHVDNWGINGLDSDGLLRRLRHPHWDLSRSVAGADVVVVTIGANDFGDHHAEVTEGRCTRAQGDCVADELASMRGRVDRSLTRIRSLRGGRPTAVLVTGYWNVFEDGDVARHEFPTAGLDASITLTRRTNRALLAAASAGRSAYVDLFAPFQRRGTGITRLLAEDGDHPSAEGHALIARVLLAAGLPGLSHP